MFSAKSLQLNVQIYDSLTDKIEVELNLDHLYIVVDGSNIAFCKRALNKKAMYFNLEIIIDYLQKLEKLFPIKWEIIVDASLRHRIDEKSKLENAIESGRIIQCPSKTEADKFILKFYNRYPYRTIIISNDDFKDHSVSNLTVCKFVIMFDEIIIYPDLRKLLESKIKNIKEVKINV